MTTPARYRALQWFCDHEEHGPDAVIARKPPTTRMRRLMEKEGEVDHEPVGQFKYRKWVLTPAGREKLKTKSPKKKGET
jgi:hypothetical protein